MIAVEKRNEETTLPPNQSDLQNEKLPRLSIFKHKYWREGIENHNGGQLEKVLGVWLCRVAQQLLDTDF